MKRELIHISKNLSEVSIDKNNDISADKIIEDTEKSLFDLAEDFSQSFIKFNVAIDQTMEMATKHLRMIKVLLVFLSLKIWMKKWVVYIIRI